MLNELTLQQRVQRGIQFLDSVRPGWELCIDMDRLNLMSGCDCVLGQLEGNYFLAQRSIFPFLLDETEYRTLAMLRGFTAESIQEDEELFEEEYARLTELWKEAIKKRQQGKVLDIHQGLPDDVIFPELDEHPF